MPQERIALTMADGTCSAHVFTPDGKGETGEVRFPAIIFYMDAGGIRPAVVAMAERLAGAGYLVFLPDLFYRFGPYEPLVPAEVLAGDTEAILGPLVATTGNARGAQDTGAFLDYLRSRPDVAPGPLGALGFCMGGGIAIAAAGAYPESIGAVASFHGGALATDAPDSPHTYAAKIKAELYIAAATDDPLYSPEMAERFQDALVRGAVPFKHEVYPAAHGWMKSDFPVYDEQMAEQGWSTLTSFFERTLKR